MQELAPRHRWRLRPCPPIDHELAAQAAALGISRRLLAILAARGIAQRDSLSSWLAPPEAGLNDPRLLPDAGAFAGRIGTAVERGERVLVFGDFDADGLCGLAILTLCLRQLGLDTEPYVPHRADEGHGLSLAAIERARAERRSLIVTVDCGTSSAAEIASAAAAGIDVLVTDHHRPTMGLPPAAAVVNPHHPASTYPDRRLAGAGVAFKLAQLLLGAEALALADLATIGTVADVAPIVGENRAICRLGLAALRARPRPGIAALLGSGGIDGARLDLESIAFGIAPRLNAVGRVGDAAAAAKLLLAEDAQTAVALAAELEAANGVRRELLSTALGHARAALDAAGGREQVTVVAGPWPIGIVGLVAGRLADEHGRPAVVFSDLADPWRGSARSAGNFDLAAAFSALADLFTRFGGHAAAAGCHLPAENFSAFRQRLLDLAGALAPVAPELVLDLIVDALDTDYRLLRELATLEPTGTGNPPPLVGIAGLAVGRVRPARGGHTQLVLRKGREVLDGICFGRDDLPALLAEEATIDVVARLGSRSFAGYESLQLEVRDVAPPGTLAALAQQTAAAA
ncbi:MAG: single-stranded-DNA-specific exonuclease RecJ [Chloroflexota bacterium]|nr:single-stranded-DNA-specific exonuclease RecJ [Chloroflexota bacterium]